SAVPATVPVRVPADAPAQSPVRPVRIDAVVRGRIGTRRPEIDHLRGETREAVVVLADLARDDVLHRSDDGHLAALFVDLGVVEARGTRLEAAVRLVDDARARSPVEREAHELEARPILLRP